MPTFTITIIGGSREENRSTCEAALSYFSSGEVTHGGNVISEQNGAAHRTTAFAGAVTQAYAQRQVDRACRSGQTASVR